MNRTLNEKSCISRKESRFVIMREVGIAQLNHASNKAIRRKHAQIRPILVNEVWCFTLVGRGRVSVLDSIPHVICRTLPKVFNFDVYERRREIQRRGIKISKINAVAINVSPQLALRGIASSGNDFFAGSSGTDGSNSGYSSRQQSESQKNGFGYSNRELGISKLRKSLSLSRHAFLRVQIGLSIIIGLIVGGLILDGTYLFLAKDNKRLGGAFVMGGFLTWVGFGGWLLGYIG